jgi:antitoxin CptB
MEVRLGERELSKLRWRCRRGLLENDLFIERFFSRHQETLTTGQAKGLEALMALSDNDLLDLLLRRKQVQQIPELGDERLVPEVHDVLALLRQPPN